MSMNTNLQTLLTLSLTLFTLFSLSWYYSFLTKKFSWVDFLWSFSFIIIILEKNIFQYFHTQTFQFSFIELLYLVWSIRLSSHLFIRIKNSEEDNRYKVLKEKWKVWYGIKFFILFQIQFILALILSIPLWLDYSNSSLIIKMSAVIIFILAISAETLADFQLKEFKRLKKGRVCNVGLWKYSRHPNYFFEWLIWVSFAIYGLSSKEKWIALIPATIMYLLLTKVTGIPPAEESSLKSKKQEYEDYQKQTNAFFPWFRNVSLFLVITLISFLNSNNLAYGGNVENIDKIKKVFTELNANNMGILDQFYAKDAQFLDPIGSHQGLDDIRKYYQNLYQNVKAINFKFTEIVVEKNTYVAFWVMTYSVDKLNSGKEIVVHGNSHIKFNDQNLVSYHRDYFDMGEMIYEHIPLFGWGVKKIKDNLKE